MRSGTTRANFQLEQINAEIFTLTYGSLVRQLLADYDDLQEVHKQLEKMCDLTLRRGIREWRSRGRNIGTRLVDDFLSKSHQRCRNFREAADVIARHAFPMFLNVATEVREWNADATECSIVFWDNPLADFVELPMEYKDLKYSNVLCGVIAGALESINMSVECDFRKDMLKGDDCYELRLKLVAHEAEQYPFKDDE